MFAIADALRSKPPRCARHLKQRGIRVLASRETVASIMLVDLLDKLGFAEQAATLRTPFKAAGCMRLRVSGNCGLNHARAFG